MRRTFLIALASGFLLVVGGCSSDAGHEKSDDWSHPNPIGPVTKLPQTGDPNDPQDSWVRVGNTPDASTIYKRCDYGNLLYETYNRDGLSLTVVPSSPECK